MLRQSRFGSIGVALSLALLFQASVRAQFGDLSRRGPTTAPATSPTTAPATAPAAGSKTAENAEFRFRVSYPPTWEERPIVQKRAALILAPVGSKPGKGFEVRPSWIAVVSTNPKMQAGGDINAVATQFAAAMKEAFEDPVVEAAEDVKLGGDTAAKRIRYAGTRNRQRIRSDTTLALKDGKLYDLTGRAPAEEFDAHRQAFDQFVATFQWTGDAVKSKEK